MTTQQTKEHVIPKRSHSKAFAESLGILTEEIELALQWNRPSILLAVHNSKAGQIEAQQALEQKIVNNGKRVAKINGDSNKPDVILVMSETPNAKDMVFFVSGIENADTASDGQVYRALNIRRELLVEKGIRVVFWLNKSEAANLPRLAPDFWSFRHRVVEFSPKRGTKKQFLPMGLFLWEEHIPWMEEKAQKNKLEYYEKSLMELPKEEGSATLRIETTLKLAHYSWLINDQIKFSDYLNNGIDLLKKYPIPFYQAWMLNAKGIGLYEEENKKDANIFLAQALKHDPNNCAIMMNTSIAAHGLGKNSEAIQIAKQAIKKDMENPYLWQVFGYLLLSMGKTEDAIESMTKARNLNPHSGEFYYSLAVCYFKNTQPDQCTKELSKAETISSPQNTIETIYIDVLSGKIDEAIARLKNSLETNAVNKQLILRDTNLNFLLNLQEFMAS